ncbi:hypothetical protein Tco_0186371 [Tanacetum coccineum]
MVKIHTDYNVADLLTKGFDAGRHVKRGRDTKIPQSSGPPVKVGDEAVHKELGDRMERAATTASSLEAEQDSDAQTRFEAASKQSNDPPLSRVNTLRSGEDSIKLMELMAHCTTLYGYIKNHMKTVKNKQARTRESEEYQKEPKNQSRSQKSQASVKISQEKSKCPHNDPTAYNSSSNDWEMNGRD